MKKILLAFIILSLFAACQGNTNGAKEGDATRFFDVKGFFNGEIKRLAEGSVKIQKTVTIAGKAETKIIEKADFDKELALFITSDINKPAWRDKYRIEKTAGRSLESFIAKDEDLKTKRLDIYRFPPNGVTQIQIVNSDRSSVTESQQNLNYDIGKGYSIETFQQFLGSDSSKIRIDVVFMK